MLENAALTVGLHLFFSSEFVEIFFSLSSSSPSPSFKFYLSPYLILAFLTLFLQVPLPIHFSILPCRSLVENTLYFLGSGLWTLFLSVPTTLLYSSLVM